MHCRQILYQLSHKGSPRTLEWVAISSPMHESEVAQSCPTLSDPMNYSLPGSSIHGIFQASTGVGCRCLLHYFQTAATAKSLQSCPTLCDPIDDSPPGSPVPGILQARTLEWVAISFPMHESEVAQSCLTLSNPMDCNLPGSSIHGIFQARVLEWGAIAFST